MPNRREEILDAAIGVLGRLGARGITHRAVDAAAGVPAGSTSNYFRTRDTLLNAVVERFAARERAAWEQISAMAGPSTIAELAAALTTFVLQATGAQRSLTLARYALFVEAALRPELQGRLADTAGQLRAWSAHWLRTVGSTDPERDAQIVLDQLDGMMLHQLAFPNPQFDPAGRLEALIGALIQR